jgi:hypothetical protein
MSDSKEHRKKRFQYPKLSEVGYLGLVLMTLMAFASLSWSSEAYQGAVIYASIVAGIAIVAADGLLGAQLSLEDELEAEGNVTVLKTKSSAIDSRKYPQIHPQENSECIEVYPANLSLFEDLEVVGEMRRWEAMK